ncbi:MAG: Homoserine dehydrogenase [uncultured Sphingomonadaceae bacterium]|uniref:Homoserine dehydrogenase n=1 Tax=uncultured Sphingomonadaceae bacterium TaxID=169976 RepID=A0A6J4S5R5_9SPHN|nr:MAG: Homoserine dehydrogenase [uncultured Sphingomonadaceae bacterium]
MPTPLMIGLAGLGTVGGGMLKLLDTNRALIERRAGRPIRVVAVSARDRHRARDVDLSPYQWTDDAAALAARDDLGAVVELIGGADGPALVIARETLGRGTPLITANKAMLAHHGMELAALAEARGAALKYEAAVAGGVPVIKALREGAAANRVARVQGILNGTCNYILSAMESEGVSFDRALAAAQGRGFAEADPSFDVDGTDAAHKLAILAALAFGTRLDFGAVRIEGIRRVTAADISEAAALGYRVRLVGQAEAGPVGLFQRVAPCLVPLGHPLAHATGATNAVAVEGSHLGRLLLQGAGAGEGPTASAVVADLIDVARGEAGPAFAMPSDQLAVLAAADAGARRGRAYLRFTVADRPGVLAEITAATRDAGVSIASLIQRGAGPDGAVTLVMVTHAGEERCVADALRRLAGSAGLLKEPMLMRILGE